MKNLSIKITLIALLSLIFACQKNTACLLPEGGCDCPAGYEGQDCSVKATQKFVGRYQDDNYLFIKDTSTTLNRVNIAVGTKQDGSGGTLMFGNVDGSHINIPFQQVPTPPTFVQFVSGEICLEKQADNTMAIVTKLNFSTQSSGLQRRVWRKVQ